MSDEMEETSSGISRRQFVQSGALVTGMLWAAPAMSTLGARAFAGTPSQQRGPNQCEVLNEAGELVQGPRPIQIEWEWTRGTCADTDALQTIPVLAEAPPTDGTRGGTSGCWFDTDLYPNGSNVRVKIRGEVGGSTGITDKGVLEKGDKFVTPEGSWTEIFVFSAVSSDVLIHYVQMHTSCSKPLAVGDQFGGFRIVRMQFDDDRGWVSA